MNQPERQMLLNYRVDHLQENVSLEIFGPGGINIPTKDLRLTQDTLFFSFKKVEEQVMVSCALQKLDKNFYCGRCTDPDGKWALFSMQYNPKKFRHFKGIRCACHG